MTNINLGPEVLAVTQENDFDPVPDEFKSVVDASRLESLLLSFSDITQKEVAESAGIAQPTLSNYLAEAVEDSLIKRPERGEYRPSKEFVGLLSGLRGDGKNWNERARDNFLNTFTGEERKHVGRALSSAAGEPQNQRGNSLIDRLKEQEEQTDVEFAVEDKSLEDDDRRLVEMSISGARNAEIADELGISENAVSVQKGRLKSRGFLKKTGAERGRGVEWEPGEKLKEQDFDPVSEQDQEGFAGEEEETSADKPEVTVERDSITEYEVTDVFSHFAGEQVLDEETADYIEDSYGSSIDDLDPIPLEVLGHDLMMGVIKNLGSLDSVRALSEELGMEQSDVEKSLGILEKAGLVSLEEHKYSLGFDPEEKYDEVREIVEAIDQEIKDGISVEIEYHEEEESLSIVPENVRYDVFGDGFFEIDRSEEEPGIDKFVDDPGHEIFGDDFLELTEEPEEYDLLAAIAQAAVENNPVEALEYAVRDAGGEISYGELTDILGVEREDLVGYMIEARDEGLNVRREYRGGEGWVFLEEDEVTQETSTDTESRNQQEVKTNGAGLDTAESGEPAMSRAMYRPDFEEGLEQYRHERDVDLGESVEPEMLPGAKQVTHDGQTEDYRDLWAPKVEPIINGLEEGDEIRYDEIQDEADRITYPRVMKTISWIAQQWGNVETYENGIRIKE